jgi:DNA modification methylase
MSEWLNRCHFGGCLATLRRMPAAMAHTCVTSPPYYGLRDYGHPEQIGMESTPEEFVATLVEVFREMRRVLRDDGTCWVNMGDSYASAPGQSTRGGAPSSSSTLQGNGHRGGGPKLSALARIGKSENKGNTAGDHARRPYAPTLKPKDLIGVPWMLAFALRADGWYLRQDIVWAKPNPMPESVRDRCTKAHEYIFLLSKSERYYFDQGAIAEHVAESTVHRLAQDVGGQAGSWRVPGKASGPMKAVSRRNSFARTTKDSAGEHGQKPQFREDREPIAYEGRRNKRSVWTVATRPYSGAHFAVFPPELIEPCILAGAPGGGVVLDPFFGSGTTGQVAQQLGRQWIGCELNPAYRGLQDERLRQPGLMLESAIA